MQNTTITKEELRTLVAEEVRDVFDSELMKFRTLALPLVSRKEQREIVKSLHLADLAVGKKIRVTL